MPALPYLAPLTCFVTLAMLTSLLPRAWYPPLYCANMAVTTCVLWRCSAAWTDLRGAARVLKPAVLVGLAVFLEWILVEQYVPYPHLGQRTSFNPYAEITSPFSRFLFLTFRFWGLVLVVPLAEELCWRSFVPRFWTTTDAASLPPEACSHHAFAVSAIGFAATHSEWLAAIICAVAYSWLLKQTRSLFACVVAHAVTNLALGSYVLLSHEWHYW